MPKRESAAMSRWKAVHCPKKTPTIQALHDAARRSESKVKAAEHALAELRSAHYKARDALADAMDATAQQTIRMPTATRSALSAAIAARKAKHANT